MNLEPLVVHTPYLPNLSTAHAGIYERSVRALNDDLDICERIGADYLIIHPGAYSEGRSVDEGIDRFGQAMTSALAGHPGSVMVLLENMAGGGRRLGSTFEELSRMRQAVTPSERIGFCLDTAHTLAAGFPLSTAVEVAETLSRFESVLGLSNLKVIHANDSDAPLGAQRDWHQHIGKGHIGLEGFRALVNHPTLQNIPFILETPRDAIDDDLKNLAVLRGLLKP